GRPGWAESGLVRRRILVVGLSVVVDVTLRRGHLGDLRRDAVERVGGERDHALLDLAVGAADLVPRRLLEANEGAAPAVLRSIGRLVAARPVRRDEVGAVRRR